jgi:predicted AlkP superfamily pyrophosphatase or phosphodiesterase
MAGRGHEHIMNSLRRLAVLCALLLTCGGLAATDTSIARVNAPEQRDKPYLVLISVDGFRWDFADRYGAEHIASMPCNRFFRH